MLQKFFCNFKKVLVSTMLVCQPKSHTKAGHGSNCIISSSVQHYFFAKSYLFQPCFQQGTVSSKVVKIRDCRSSTFQDFLVLPGFCTECSVCMESFPSILSSPHCLTFPDLEGLVFSAIIYETEAGYLLAGK